jgi:hypothetical protein
LCPFGPLLLSANVGAYDILPVLANATLIHLLEVIRLEVGVGHQGGLQLARKRYSVNRRNILIMSRGLPASDRRLPY